MTRERLYLSDTTLRDGQQTRGADSPVIAPPDHLSVIARLDRAIQSQPRPWRWMPRSSRGMTAGDGGRALMPNARAGG